MFRTRGRKIIGDVLARKGRTALVSIAIFIGVAGTIALFSLSDIVISQLREDIKEDELVMLDVFVTVSAGETVDNEAYLAALDSIPGVTEVIGAVQGFGQFKVNADDADYTGMLINGYSVPLEDGLPIEPLRLVGEGRYPTAGANEVALEQRMAEKYGLAVGDTIFLRVLSASRMDGTIGSQEPWTITGLVFHPYAGSNSAPGQPGPSESIYTSIEDAMYVSGSTGWTNFRARFTDFPTAEEQSKRFTDYIAQDTPYIPVFIALLDPAQNALLLSAQTLAGTMSFLALIALVVSGFLVVNVITSIVVEQKRQIGVMKSLGATRMDNFFIYSGIAFMYGLLGVIPGVLVGIPGGNAAAQQLAPSLNTVLDGFKISPPSIVMGVIMGLLIPVLASIIPVFFGTRVKILDAMTDLGISGDYGKGWQARLINLLPVPITVRQGISNVSIKKTRLAFTVITLAIAAGAFMGIFAVFNSLTSGIGLYIDSFNVEIGVFPNETRAPEEVQAILQEFNANSDVKLTAIEPGFQSQVEFEGYAPPLSAGGPPGIFAYGYDINSETPAFNFEVSEGELLTESNAETGIIFSSLLAANMGKTVGDQVVMRVPGNTVELTIVGIADFPLDQVWLDWRSIAKILGYTIGAPKPNEYLTTVMATGYDGQISVVGFDAQIANFLTFSDGGFVTPGEPGVILNTSAAENGGYAVGDVLTLTNKNGDSGAFPVTGIFEIPPFAQSDEIPTDVMGMFWQDLARFEGLDLGGQPIPAGYFVVTELQDASVDDIDKIMRQVDELMLTNGVSALTFNFVELTEQISQVFFTFQVILQMVALLIALVGALGLLTTLSMSVFERQKEIGVMRSIGAGSGTVAAQFLTEGLIVGVIAWLVGLPLGYLIQITLLDITGFSETFSSEFPLVGAVIGLVGMLIITTLASLGPSISASRKTVSDILRYQ